MVRIDLSKAIRQYFTFATSASSKILLSYLNERLANGKPLPRERQPLRAIDYNVIARSLFGSSFATWSILELSVLTIITAKGYWGTF